MIKFFRQIRYHLMEQNKTSRYLKYAVGEIILVVIGILLALQLNNWNQNYQTKKANTTFLEKLITELDQNEERLQSLIKDGSNGWPGLKTSVKNCDSLLKLTYQGLTIDHLDFVLQADLDSGGSKYSINTSTYQELLNTGKLYSLGSESLIKAITNYFNLYEREEEYHDDNANSAQETSKKLDSGFLVIRLDAKMDSLNFDINDYPWYFDSTSENYRNLQIGLNAMKQNQSNNLRKTQLLIDSTHSFKAKLLKELKSL